ncbi:MAG TPA: ABC transporter ATP-binding protein [Chloroflexota bacterium]|jgi:NitT/TauT family transport system ATP-binding protein
MTANASLQLRDVRKVYQSDHGALEAIGGITCDVAPGSFTAVVGPSGCGKSTLLQIMAGLVPATSGQVLLDGTAVVQPPLGAIYVFQQYTKSIYPWKTVLGNVTFGLAHRRTAGPRPSKAEIERRCQEMLAVVGLEAFARYYPYQLSGGMQQRVALARALVCQPQVLLMDEPYSAVDALTRTELQDMLLRLWSDLRPTIVFVTHDIDEAIYLSERVVVLTRAPARISRTVEVALPGPRGQIETKEHPMYLEYRRLILEDIMAQTRPASAPAPAAR